MEEKKFSVEELAAQLSNYAQLTASNSKNWHAFQAICEDALRAAMKAAKEP